MAQAEMINPSTLNIVMGAPGIGLPRIQAGPKRTSNMAETTAATQ